MLDEHNKDLGKGELPSIDSYLRELGAPGLIIDAEPHMKGGGQFGGWSGPDGFGIAVNAIKRLLYLNTIYYDIRSDADIMKKVKM